MEEERGLSLSLPSLCCWLRAVQASVLALPSLLNKAASCEQASAVSHGSSKEISISCLINYCLISHTHFFPSGAFYPGHRMVLDQAGVDMTLSEHGLMGDKGQRKAVVPLASE